MRRYALRDHQWDRIKDILPGREGHVGGAAAIPRCIRPPRRLPWLSFLPCGMRRCEALELRFDRRFAAAELRGFEWAEAGHCLPTYFA